MEPANILICEDEFVIAEDIKSRLQALGYNVLGIADSSDEAFREVDRIKPDLALMDICLKGEINGIQVAERLRRNYSVPVIFLTSLADSETLDQAKKTEPLGYITKPFQSKELQSAIEIGLYRHKQQQELKKEMENSRIQLEHEKNKSSVAEKIIDLQKQLMEVQKMEAVRTLAGGIAHHVNNTLFAVIGTLQYLMQSREGGGEITNHNDLIKSVLQKCDRTALIIKNLLLFTERTNYPTEEVRIAELVTEAIEDISPLLKNNFRLKTYFSTSPLLVRVDKRKVKQVVSELLLNAYDALSANGIVTIHTELEHKEDVDGHNKAATKGWYVHLKITDNGHGMNEKVLKRVFEPFFTTRTDGEAIGLGLSLAYAAMQIHGGWINVDSVEGVGTSVSLFFPCIEPTIFKEGDFEDTNVQ